MLPDRTPLTILISYWHVKGGDLLAYLHKYYGDDLPLLFADSGAFSAYRKGLTIPVEEYADWLQTWRHLFVQYTNLDVIGRAPATLHNQHVLEGQGLTPLPVFHWGEPVSYLQDYCANYSCVGIGGIAKMSRAASIRWLIACFKLAGETKLHGFGITHWETLRDLPWHSTDSTSWSNGGQFGKITVFDPQGGRWYKCHTGDARSCFALGPLLRSYGFTPEELAVRGLCPSKRINALGILSWINAERWLHTYWKRNTPTIFLTAGHDHHKMAYARELMP